MGNHRLCSNPKCGGCRVCFPSDDELRVVGPPTLSAPLGPRTEAPARPCPGMPNYGWNKTTYAHCPGCAPAPSRCPGFLARLPVASMEPESPYVGRMGLYRVFCELSPSCDHVAGSVAVANH